MGASAISMKPVRLSLLLALLMSSVAIATYSVRLSPKVKPSAPAFILEKVVPANFAEWRIVESQGVQVVTHRRSNSWISSTAKC